MSKYEYLFVIAAVSTILLIVGSYVLNQLNSMDMAGVLL